MDTTIIAAIIGAIATVLAAIIGILSHRRKVATSVQRFEKSKALRLGYVLAAIECYLDAQKMKITNSVSISDALSAQSKRAYEIAKTLGISVNPDANALIKDLPLKLDTKPIAVKNTFRIGNIIGRVYFYAISLMTTGSLPPIDDDIERLRDAEQLLGETDLPSDFLKPFRTLWKEALQAAHKGKFYAIDEQMEKVLDQLCKSIESDTRARRITRCLWEATLPQIRLWRTSQTPIPLDKMVRGLDNDAYR